MGYQLRHIGSFYRCGIFSVHIQYISVIGSKKRNVICAHIYIYVDIYNSIEG